VVPPEEGAVWARFAGARSAEEFCLSWLTILCRSLAGAQAAFLLLEEEPGQYKVGAAWPDPAGNLAHLAPAAEQALRQGRGLVHQAALGATHVAYPVEVAGHKHGVVVVELGAAAPGGRDAVLRQLHWGVGWLETLFRRRDAEQAERVQQRSAFALAALEAAGEQRHLMAAAMAVVNEIAVRLPCRRASLGFCRGGRVRLAAMSHGVAFARRSQLVAAIENAMEEALEQNATITQPARPRVELRQITLSHGELSRLSGAPALATLALPGGSTEGAIGVLLVERDADVFDEILLERLEAAAALLGPAFEPKLRAHRLLDGRLVAASERLLAAVFGPRKPGAKLLAVLAIAALAALLLWRGTATVSGEAVVEAAQLHSIAAPFDGFITEAPVRAGDRVTADQTLARLDDRAFRLDALKARSELQQQALKYADAVGKQDRVAIGVLQASMDEARAELAIVEDKIARSSLHSAIDGTIVSGDLSQMIGAPVERGKVLFEVAPLDAWRVAINVDERDVAAVRAGQTGRLVLAGLTGQTIRFTVRAVLPVAATSADGQNTFRVEAELQDHVGTLRPGMEGVGKIRIGEQKLLAIWLRPVAIWLRMTLWRWWP
jgi:multidrug efflux pump subunit AcrA (membrane-fusion protein)